MFRHILQSLLQLIHTSKLLEVSNEQIKAVVNDHIEENILYVYPYLEDDPLFTDKLANLFGNFLTDVINNVGDITLLHKANYMGFVEYLGEANYRFAVRINPL